MSDPQPTGPGASGPRPGAHRYPPPSPYPPPTPQQGSVPPQQRVAPPPPPAAPPPGAFQYPGAGPAPAYGYGQPFQQGKPSAYWPLSIVALLFFLVFGAIGLYFSSEVGNRWGRGDLEGARKASRTALTLDVIGIVLGVIVILVWSSSGSTGSSGY